MKWLVTGGCGFLGAKLIERLSTDSRNSIRVLDNLSVGDRSDLGGVISFTELHVNSDEIAELTPGSCQLIKGDVTNQKVAQRAAASIDVIVHLAANTGVPNSVDDPRLDMNSNVVGTFNMLEAARVNGVQRFVFASSGAPAGEVTPPIHEELPAHPVSPYGASKLAGEGYCSAYSKTFGIDTVALRFGNVYGPGSKKKGSVVAKFIRKALNGQNVEVYGDGSQTRDFIFVDDLIDAVIKASTKDSVGGEVFQIATSKETTINELIDSLNKSLGTLKLDELEVKYSEKRRGDVSRNYSDTSKAKLMLDWQAKTKVEDGITQTISWFLKTNF